MKKLKSYISLALIGGLLVILPLVVFILATRWLLRTLGNLVSPVSDPVMVTFGLPPLLSDFLVVIAFLLACVFVGLIVRTAVGRWIHDAYDHWMSKLAPGYRTIKAMIQQLVGVEGANGPLKGEVVLVKIFGPEIETSMTAIVTSKHKNGWVTVYVPTAPIPTSGLTYHVPPESIEYLTDVSTEEAMRTIVACGAGTSEMLSPKQLAR